MDELNWNEWVDSGSIGGCTIDSIGESGKKIPTEAQSGLDTYGLVSVCVLVDSHGVRAAQLIPPSKRMPADLIVMSKHGCRGFILTLGSDATEVARGSLVQPARGVPSASQAHGLRALRFSWSRVKGLIPPPSAIPFGAKEHQKWSFDR